MLNVVLTVKTKAKNRIIIIKTSADDENLEEIKWISEDANFGEAGDIDIKVINGENGESTVINMVYIDESGEKAEHSIEINEDDIVNSIEKTLKDMNIHIEMDFSDDGNTQTVKVIENEDNNESSLFESISLTVNKSSRTVEINFTPTTKAKTSITIADQDGTKLFTDSYNGKTEYAKKIKVPQGTQNVLITIEQGNEIEIRKLKLD